MSAAIGMKQTYMIDIVQWIEDVQKRLASAIVPLPKPDKVEPGQKWAKQITVVSVGVPGFWNDAVIDQFGQSRGCVELTRQENWFYLGS